MAGSAISNVSTSTITGNIGISPADSTVITGFSLKMDSSGIFSTSSQVTGNVYAPNYDLPTPAELATAISDMSTAFNDDAGRTSNYTDLYSGDIGGQTLIPDVYKWITGVTINSDVILNGGTNSVWIFQTAVGITQSSDIHIILTGEAQAKNIFWQSGGGVTIGATAQFEGVILGQTSITMMTDASINGQLFGYSRHTCKNRPHAGY